ncbi:putative gamma-glutamylcyclotransferase CG2811 isoform X2 [Anoplophora glabripennis]|uniref:putative gamma-glutamylcyclotransferase CG2811 isoform X2 n=1 Tax=Anoplophora glabripennis TaxID=217634 RepID=UPI000874234A|nr:putative gamma-glutamylcyclotransferase CG2811 isoform X2 [Anoplophora glabripennis]
MAAPSILHKVFVYGTLKRGEPNHQWFSMDQEGHYKYLYDAKTVEKFPLIIGTKYNIPFILYSPGNGNHVQGEVYQIDNKVLAKLDTLEDHPNYYIRDLYDVESLNETREKTKAWIYVIKNFKKDLLNQPFYESYSNSGSHGKRYMESEDSSLDDL